MSVVPGDAASNGCGPTRVATMLIVECMFVGSARPTGVARIRLAESTCVVIPIAIRRRNGAAGGAPGVGAEGGVAGTIMNRVA